MAGSYQPWSLRGLAQSAGVGSAMQRAAGAGKTWAESVAPRASGRYAGSFRVEAATVRGGRRNEPRAGAALVNTAPYAGVVERRSRILARSVNIIEGQR